MALTIAKTSDEHGKDRYFVEDENGDWIGDAHDTPESAQAEIDMLAALDEEKR